MGRVNRKTGYYAGAKKIFMGRGCVRSPSSKKNGRVDIIGRTHFIYPRVKRKNSCKSKKRNHLKNSIENKLMKEHTRDPPPPTS